MKTDKIITFAQAQHLYGVIADFFSHLSECSLEYGEEFDPSADFFKVCLQDLTAFREGNKEERIVGASHAQMVSALAKSVMDFVKD